MSKLRRPKQCPEWARLGMSGQPLQRGTTCYYWLTGRSGGCVEISLLTGAMINMAGCILTVRYYAPGSVATAWETTAMRWASYIEQEWPKK